MKEWKVNQKFVESGNAESYVKTLNFLGVGAMLDEGNVIKFDYDRALRLPKKYWNYNMVMTLNFKTMLAQTA